MQDTGIVRHIDRLGRVVIPIELRRTLGMGPKDPVAIYTQGDAIVLRRHEDACLLCGSAKNVRKVNDRNVCAACVTAVKKLR